MNLAHLWALLGSVKLLMVATLLSTFAALPASAQGTAQSFVQDPYYLGLGGTPPTLLEFADNPRMYLRSEAAYVALRQRFADVLGLDTLSEQGFQELLRSDQVRLRPCTDFGRFRTYGVLPTNVVVDSSRTTCYVNEKFIEVNVRGVWKVAGSQGCFNPVILVRPPQPPKQLVCRNVPFSSVVGSGMHQHLDGTWYPSNCGNPLHVPGYTITIPNTVQSGGFYRICE